MTTQRPTTLRGRLARAGLTEPGRAEQLLAELGGEASEAELRSLARVADPDQALLGLVRLREALERPERHALRERVDPDDAARDRLVGLLGASSALTDHLVRHPEQWRDVVDAERRDRDGCIEALRADVASRGETSAYDALRVAYRRQMVQIAALDVAGDALEELPHTARALADLAASALQVALEIAADQVEDADRARLCVIAMGKTGGRELNYISDVDVVFVAEPAEGVDEDEALAVATSLATELMRVCSASTAEGSLWQVDAALRPEGKNGPLVRTVASHRAYYERWAKTWEFQALLKARPVAGDTELGQEYLDAVWPFVWQASKREDFVEDVQAMRRRVEQHVPRAEAARQIKLGPGGLRDIEFSVQLLQLVHGRTDEGLRWRGTLAGLRALSERGYVGRQDAAQLDEAYRRLRVMEHRIQLYRMRRTHLMPTAEGDLRRLGRALGLRSEPEKAVVEMWREVAREVRRMHEKLFYRPLLSAVARLDDDEAHLSTEDARDRLAALGFGDPAGAIRHIESLSAGVSRRAQMQRHLLPVMLRWFAEEADPDAGLLAFRKISEELGTSPWFLKQLREGSSAEHLARMLASSRYVAAMLERSPSSVAMLDDEEALRLPDRETILRRLTSAARRAEGHEEQATAVRAARRTELLRVAMADLVRETDLDTVEESLSAIASATLEVLLQISSEVVRRDLGEAVTSLAVIGMGRLGGREIGYASDADVMFVHDPHEGADDKQAQEQALAVVAELRRLAALPGPDPAFELDAALRPEGKAGPLVRSLGSYAAYYERWSEGWEAQALLRARPVAGDPALCERFVDLIDPLRYPDGGISERSVRQIRTLKARMEAERIPRGGDRRTHFKLGYGGLSDVEWTVQLLQLQHAHELPGLRHTGTMTPLAVAADAGLIDPEDAETLREAWQLASRMRNASVLWRGKPVEAVPGHLRDGDGIGRILGYPPQAGPEMNDEYRRRARRARAVVEHVFYETPTGIKGPRLR